MSEAWDEIRQWREYRPTPLVDLDGLAGALGVGRIYYKDESERLGLGSFKALGGAYGVLKFLQKELSRRAGKAISMESIRRGDCRDIVRGITVVAATDGNHGRSVAWGAQLFGCSCRIYVHSEVSRGRVEAIEEYGAEIVRIDGNYDESVRLADYEATANGWHMISDTSYEGYTEIPPYILAGYTVMAEEIAAELEGAGKPLPSHVFLQGGVGGLASAVCAHSWQSLGADRPRFIIAEPELAPCLLESCIRGAPATVDVIEETIMRGLSCGKASTLSWEIIGKAADDFLTLSESGIPDMMRLLARGAFGAPKIVAGETGVVGLAALAAVQRDEALSASLGLDENSVVLLFGTEGATDPEVYARIIDGASG